MADVGRPTELTDELLLKIKGLVLEGRELTEIAEILDIPYKTMESWCSRNYQGFADSLLAYKHEKKLKKAEQNLEDFLEMSEDNKFITKKGDVLEFRDPKLVKIKADVSIFVAETLGKKHYAKKQELEHGGHIKEYIITRGEDAGGAVPASPEPVPDNPQQGEV